MRGFTKRELQSKTMTELIDIAEAQSKVISRIKDEDGFLRRRHIEKMFPDESGKDELADIILEDQKTFKTSKKDVLEAEEEIRTGRMRYGDKVQDKER